MNEKVLGIETTSRQGSVALIDRGICIDEHILDYPLKHSNYMMPAIDSLLNTHGVVLDEIDTIAVGIGPGSFTGIRVGIAIAKGLVFGRQQPRIVGIQSMQNIALSCPERATTVIVVVYAQKNEFFTQQFRRENDMFVPVTQCEIRKADEIQREPDCVICGPDIERFAVSGELPGRIIEHPVYPTARMTACCIETVTDRSENELRPLYVRRSEAEVKGPKEYGL